jgi:hypothetical protein
MCDKSWGQGDPFPRENCNSAAAAVGGGTANSVYLRARLWRSNECTCALQTEVLAATIANIRSGPLSTRELCTHVRTLLPYRRCVSMLEGMGMRLLQMQVIFDLWWIIDTQKKLVHFWRPFNCAFCNFTAPPLHVWSDQLIILFSWCRTCPSCVPSCPMFNSHSVSKSV